MVINTTKLARSRTYRQRLIGTPAAYTTPAGTHVNGIITEHPMYPGGMKLAITQADGRWCTIHAGETVTVDA